MLMKKVTPEYLKSLKKEAAKAGGCFAGCTADVDELLRVIAAQQRDGNEAFVSFEGEFIFVPKEESYRLDKVASA